MPSWSEQISLLNTAQSPEPKEDLDDFAAFLNIPFTFEEVGGVEYGEEDRQRQVGRGEGRDLGVAKRTGYQVQSSASAYC